MPVKVKPNVLFCSGCQDEYEQEDIVLIEPLCNVLSKCKNAKDLVYVCKGCASLNKLHSFYVECKVCSLYFEKSDMVNNECCSICDKKLYDCASCKKKHFKNLKDINQQLQSYSIQYGKYVDIFCRKTKDVKRKSLKDIISAQYNTLVHAKQKEKETLQVAMKRAFAGACK